MSETIQGVAAGVPYVLVPPISGDPAAPVVLAWHLMDSPRTAAAFAAALPLAGLDAWRIYFQLPMSGSRLPEGGMDELMRLGYEDAVMNLQGPITDQAVAEAPAALAAVKAAHGIGDGPVGLLGGSQGSAVAGQLLLDPAMKAVSAVLVSPIVQLRAAVAATGRQYGVEYPWSAESDAVADRMDLVARVGEIPASAEVLTVVGAQDEPEFAESAAAFTAALGDRARTDIVAGLGHALADEPGLEPAPQWPATAEVDRLAVAWFARTLR
ncbi:alpha/beta hydrolase [Nakamurella sp. YIM 132087]|uniref:Alpha/beta hydrolase n=1 Tax=Nakamurella alba TaxID=2665158 RepID=A0A7K1FR29_9ACTN|nr:alpha/beta hydrolase [Nakamurella alba]MTD16597.1 alpha/beta hydrolase [Nakamurella alba]